jgi:hypothetical protein
MKAEEIFEKSVQVMKQLVGRDGIARSIARAKERGEKENITLLERERENINGLVRKIVDEGVTEKVLSGASQDLTDAAVLRYLRNRDIFMTTFPEGIEGIDPDPVSLWAAMMISPRDDTPE